MRAVVWFLCGAFLTIAGFSVLLGLLFIVGYFGVPLIVRLVVPMAVWVAANVSAEWLAGILCLLVVGGFGGEFSVRVMRDVEATGRDIPSAIRHQMALERMRSELARAKTVNLDGE